MNENLKPCPFCGSRRITIETYELNEKLHMQDYTGRLFCEYCGAEVYFDGGRGELGDTPNDAKKTLITCWNNRRRKA